MKDYITHDIHSYTAKLTPHLPRHFIIKYTKKGDVILDPFCGSGTSLLEARLLGRNAIGIDINPLAILISDVKTTPVNIKRLENAIQIAQDELKIMKDLEGIDFPNKDYWFCKKAQSELSKIKFIIDNPKKNTNQKIVKYLKLCFSAIIRKSSNADPRIAKIYKSRRVLDKLNRGWFPTPIKYFEETLRKNCERFKSFEISGYNNNNFVEVIQGDARKTSAILKELGINKVDFIITSPPYINAQDYFRSYKLELWWLGLATPEEVLNLKRQSIGTEYIGGGNNKPIKNINNLRLKTVLKSIERIDPHKSQIVYNYFGNMMHIINEFYKVLKMKSHFCLITGNNTICKVRVPTYKILIDIAKDTGFELVEVVKDKIINRSLPPNRNHDGGVIKEEWITVFRKGGKGR